MEPNEALSATAQVAVALAGFAGVVVAFRSGSVHEWSRIDKFRLQILLVNSGVPFALSIVAMLVLAMPLYPTRIWQTCSVLMFVTIVASAQQIRRGMRKLSRDEFDSGGGSRAVFYAGSAAGIAVTLLQLYNAITLKTFWPFFAALVTQLLLAMLQFIRLILAGGHS